MFNNLGLEYFRITQDIIDISDNVQPGPFPVAPGLPGRYLVLLFGPRGMPRVAPSCSPIL